jgi:hypothetical protein
MTPEKLQEYVRKMIENLMIDHVGNFVNDFEWSASDDPSEAIEKFNVSYGNYLAAFDRAVLNGVAEGINKACNETFQHCLTRAVEGDQIDQARADVLQNEWNNYSEMTIADLVQDVVGRIGFGE